MEAFIKTFIINFLHELANSLTFPLERPEEIYTEEDISTTEEDVSTTEEDVFTLKGWSYLFRLKTLSCKYKYTYLFRVSI